MAELSTLARPYAKAAFDYANENGVINEWETFFNNAKQVVENDNFKELLSNPAIFAKQKVNTLVELLNSSTDVEVSPQLNNFVTQLADNERLALIPQIDTHFKDLKAKALKQIDAYVTTAYPLTDKQRIEIQTKLAASMNATIMLHEEVDSSLIAGATIKVGDKVVDDSVRGKLKQLKTQLTA